MKRKVTYVYRCRNCGDVFYGKEPIRCFGEPRPENIHLDHDAHDTHKCIRAFGKNQWGIGDLIGCFTSSPKEAHDEG